MTFYEMVRTLGLAYVWAVVGVLAALSMLLPALANLALVIRVLALFLTVAAWVYAAKRALDLAWGKTAIAVAVGAIVFIAPSEPVVAALGGFDLSLASLGS